MIAPVSPPPPIGHVRCVHAVDPGPFAPEGALREVRAVLARQTLVNQSGTVRLLPGTYSVEDLTRLGPDRRGAPRARYFRLMRRRCGETTAERTFLAQVEIGVSQIALPWQPYLVARTRHGWRLIYAHSTR